MSDLITRIGRWFGRKPAAPAAQVRLYGGARHTNSTGGFGTSSASADAELATSLALLRSRSRQLLRDSPYAKRAIAIIVNNVVGGGVGIQAQVMTTRDELAGRVNDDIERAHAEWARAESCHTGGALHLADLERAALSEIATAGEVFIRKHYRRFGNSQVPLALEFIEPERLADNFVPGGVVPGAARMGIETDQFQRPVAYYLRDRHPGDGRFGLTVPDRVIRVPAAEMFHLRIVERWPQTRGVPWLHTVLRKLDNMDQYSAAELEAARASSYYFGTIETPDAGIVSPLATEAATATTAAQMDIHPGATVELNPGEKYNFHSPNRPNTALDPFLRYMLREVAAGTGVSYESLSRDYSQSNYSSSRLALLDDRDLWRVLQQWWVRSFREPLYREWLQAAVFARAIPAIPVDAYAADVERYLAVKWKLRGWSWIDPAKEQQAFAEAVRNGFTTLTDVIAQTANGADLEDVLKTRARELKLMEEYGIEVATTFKEPPPPAAATPPPPPDDPPDPADDGEDEPQQTTRPARVVSFGR